MARLLLIDDGPGGPQITDRTDGPTELEKRYEWQAMVHCGRAIIGYGRRLSRMTRQQAAQEPDGKRRMELEEMAGILSPVMKGDPRRA